jgi:hypothetical protein
VALDDERSSSECEVETEMKCSAVELELAVVDRLTRPGTAERRARESSSSCFLSMREVSLLSESTRRKMDCQTEDRKVQALVESVQTWRGGRAGRESKLAFDRSFDSLPSRRISLIDEMGCRADTDDGSSLVRYSRRRERIYKERGQVEASDLLNLDEERQRESSPRLESASRSRGYLQRPSNLFLGSFLNCP